MALLEQGVGNLPTVLPAVIAVLASGAYVLERRRNGRSLKEREAELAVARGRISRLESLVGGETQAWIVWDHKGAEPRLEGDATFLLTAPTARRLLGLSNWLPPDTAESLGKAIAGLVETGQAFVRTVGTTRGGFVEIDGRPIGAAAVLHVRDAAHIRRQLAEVEAERGALDAALERFRALLDLIPHPAWMRDTKGALAWVNTRYVRAVDAHSAADAIERKLELLDAQDLSASSAARGDAGSWRGRVVAVAAGERRTFDVVEVSRDGGAAAIAIDQSDLLAQRGELDRYVDANARLLDQLTTGVAIFDRAKRLVSHNAAYRRIWKLDPAFLDSKPLDGEILDKLRADRMLPEQADYKNWKAQALGGYRALEPTESIWHLPNGRALRVVASPNSQEGVTYLYDDATQNFALASQVEGLIHVQTETLEALKEAVAVFGADGRMKLVNRTFCALWAIESEKAAEHPHIDEVLRRCAPTESGTRIWEKMREQIVGMPDARLPTAERMERKDGLIIDCAAIPLPDGATLLTFLDSTAGAKVERALLERNEALVSAERIRNDFVNHVSYELRTPLTSIIGFTQLLAEGGAGPLTERQLQYAGMISKSTAALLAIINDILDLASIDAGALELRVEDIDVAETMRAAAQGVQDRLIDRAIDLRIVMTEGIGAFRADGRRVKQVLFNLLSNAIGFSSEGQTVTLTALRRSNEIVFKVSDQGRGIPPEVVDKVFDRFQSFSAGSRHRGAGLGLSIVRSLVELHGGRVVIDSAPGVGTTVTCFFPAAPALAAAAA